MSERHDLLALHLYAVVSLADELYGLDIAMVREIIRFQPITRVPRTAAYVLGVTNIRGWVVPVVDLAARLSLPAIRPSADSRIVVVEFDGELIGLAVESVAEVLQVSPEQMDASPRAVGQGEVQGLKAVARVGENRLVILLDLVRLLRRNGTLVGEVN